MIQTMMIDGKPRNVNSGEIENSGVELEFAWNINKYWRFVTNHSFLHMRYKVLAAPEYKGYVGVDFHYNRWTANTGMQFINNLYKSVGEDEQKEDFCLLNAYVSFDVTKGFSLWVRGENLLAQDYEIISGYPMPGATFMGGINLKF